MATARERRAALRAGMPCKTELTDLVTQHVGPLNAGSVLAVLDKFPQFRAAIVAGLQAEPPFQPPWTFCSRPPLHITHAADDVEGWTSSAREVAHYYDWAQDQLARTTALVHNVFSKMDRALQWDLVELVYTTLALKHNDLKRETDSQLAFLDKRIAKAQRLRADRIFKAQEENLKQTANACALHYLPVSCDDALLAACTKAELDRLCRYMSMTLPEERDNLIARITMAHPHPAWFCKAETADDAVALLRRAFVKSMSDPRPIDDVRSFRTECDYCAVQSSLQAWWESGGMVGDLSDVRIDQRLYRAFVAVLGPDAYRYVAPLPLDRLTPLCQTRVQVQLLVDQLPEECLYCNGDVEQNQAWTRPELVDHIWMHVDHGIGMPWRPYVTVLVKRALNNALTALEAARPKKAKPEKAKPAAKPAVKKAKDGQEAGAKGKEDNKAKNDHNNNRNNKKKTGKKAGE